MTGTEKQIAYATSLIEETIAHMPPTMQAAVREWASAKAASFILDHQAGLVDLCKGAAYIVSLPAFLATLPAEQRAAFFAECDKRVAYAIKQDAELMVAYETIKNI